jgi:two-component system, OmpR family, sensor kinase
MQRSMPIVEEGSAGMLRPPTAAPAGVAALRDALRSARLRILGVQAGLLALGLLLAMLGARQVLLRQLDERIDRELTDQVTHVRNLADAGVDPDTGRPFTGVERLLRVHLADVTVARNETVMVLVGGRPYGRSLGAPPVRLEGDPRLVALWAGVADPTRGTVHSSAGAVRYAAVPVAVISAGPSRSAGPPVRGDRGGQSPPRLRGSPDPSGAVFVAASFRDLRRAELDDTLMVAGAAGGAALLLAWMLTWVAAGQVLAPLRAAGEAADRGRELLDDVGHELRTPLTVIRGHLELLGDDPDERRQTIAIVSDELDRMHRMVEELQLLTASGRPGFLRADPVEVGELTAELLAKARSLTERSWGLDAAGSGWIVADRQRLTQAMMQLAENAVRHGQPGSPLWLGSAVGADEARLWVRDHGPGIAEADRRRIFERFARGAAGAPPDGAGLGLAIVQAIAEAHHGRVELASAEGHGSRFTVVLPVAAEAGARP